VSGVADRGFEVVHSDGGRQGHGPRQEQAEQVLGGQLAQGHTCTKSRTRSYEHHLGPPQVRHPGQRLHRQNVPRRQDPRTMDLHGRHSADRQGTQMGGAADLTPARTRAQTGHPPPRAQPQKHHRVARRPGAIRPNVEQHPTPGFDLGQSPPQGGRTRPGVGLSRTHHRGRPLLQPRLRHLPVRALGLVHAQELQPPRRPITEDTFHPEFRLLCRRGRIRRSAFQMPQTQTK